MEKTIEQIMNKNNIQNQLSIEQLLLTDWKNQFNEGQLKQIKEGLEQKVDVTIYAKPEFDKLQMNAIRYGLARNVDVTELLSSQIDWSQMMLTILEKLTNKGE